MRLCLGAVNSEAYDVLEPRVLGCSRFFDSLRKLVGALLRDVCSDVGGIPPVLTFWYEVRRLRPDAVVVRNPYSAYGVLAMVAGRCAGARLILYVQAPRHRRGSQLQPRQESGSALLDARHLVHPCTRRPGPIPHTLLRAPVIYRL